MITERKNKLDSIHLSCNQNPKYYEFWPIVYKTWKKLFPETKICLSFIFDPNNQEYLRALKYIGYNLGCLYYYKKCYLIPSQNQAKITRLWSMSLQGENICMLNDIDIMPLQKEYTEYCISYYEKGKIVCVGHDVYAGSSEDGKFPITYLISDGNTIKKIINPNNLEYEDWLKSFIGFKVFDHKEDISRNIDSENPDCFSDESLFRALLHQWNQWDRVIKVPRKLIHGKSALCRANWKLDQNKLKQGFYKHAHLPRPYSNNKKVIKQLIDYIDNLLM